MNKISFIILSIILALIIFVVGGGMGIFYQEQKNISQIEKMSSVISSVSIFGTVTEINNKNLTIKNSDNFVTIKMADNVKIYEITIDNNGTGKQKQFEFSQIKKDDGVNINTKLLPDGTLEAQSIIVQSLSSIGLPAK